jgi:hypothetical protein
MTQFKSRARKQTDHLVARVVCFPSTQCPTSSIDKRGAQQRRTLLMWNRHLLYLRDHTTQYRTLTLSFFGKHSHLTLDEFSSVRSLSLVVATGAVITYYRVAIA